MKRKLLTLILSVTAVISAVCFTACKSNTGDNSSTTESSASGTVSDSSSGGSTETGGESGSESNIAGDSSGSSQEESSGGQTQTQSKLAFTLSEDGEYYSVSGIGEETSATISVPAEYNGKPVKTIGSSAFENNEFITSVIIADGIAEIGNAAFKNCVALTEVSFPDSLVSIGNSAFEGCVKLGSAVIVGNAETIGKNAFGYCPISKIKGKTTIISELPKDNLTTAEITDGDAITDGLFNGCSLLAEISISDSVTDIKANAFKDCVNLKSIVVGDNVTSIGSSAFEGCLRLEKVTMGSGVRAIGSAAFTNCERIKEVNIKSVESWCEISFNGENSNPLNGGGSLFLNGERVTALVIPDSITQIKPYAFCYYSGLKSVVFPQNLTTIGAHAFKRCSGLSTLVISDNVTLIDCGAFYSCYNLVSVTLGKSVEIIGTSNNSEDRAFGGCNKLLEVVNHSNLELAGDLYGRIVSNAKEIKTEGESAIDQKDDFLFYTYEGENYLVGYIGNETNLTLPESYDDKSYAVYDYAFWSSSITKLVVPAGVTKICAWAFSNCSTLASIAFKGECDVAEEAFLYSYKITEAIGRGVLIKKSYTYYEDDIKAPCTKDEGESDIVKVNGYLFFSLEGKNYLVGYEGNETALTLPQNYNGQGYEILKYAFYGNTNIKSVVIPEAVTEIGDYAFYNCKNLTQVSMKGVEEIGAYSFYGCGIESLVLPDSLNTIGAYAFNLCDLLESVDTGNGVKTIGYFAFGVCRSLKKLVLGNNIKEIGDSAFFGNPFYSVLESVIIPDSVTKIGDSAFSHIKSLKSVILGDGVQTIGNHAFGYCENLIEITIPESVTKIGDKAFERCYALLKITYKGSAAQWNAIKFGSGWNLEVPKKCETIFEKE